MGGREAEAGQEVWRNGRGRRADEECGDGRRGPRSLWVRTFDSTEAWASRGAQNLEGAVEYAATEQNDIDEARRRAYPRHQGGRRWNVRQDREIHAKPS